MALLRIGMFASLLLLFLMPLQVSGIELKPATAIDPSLPSRPEVERFVPEFKPMWVQSLARPEADFQRQSISAITQAHRLGMEDLEDTLPRMVALLKAPETHPAVWEAAALAIIEFDDRGKAKLLSDAADRHGIKLARLVEPALARWDYQPMRAIWLARLGDVSETSETKTLAIAGLAQVGEKLAADPLRKLMLSPATAAELRLESARALVALHADGILANSGVLSQSNQWFERLLAAVLLSEQSGAEAMELLLNLAIDREPAVQAFALQRLLELDPTSIAPLWDKIISSADDKVRRLAATAVFEDAKPKSVAILAAMLDDPHPGIRDDAAHSLIELAARPEFDKSVRAAMTTILAGEQVRPLELAIFVLGTIRHEPAADRLVQLLKFKEPKINIAAAWALAELALPETGEPILQLVRQQLKQTDLVAAEMAKMEDDYQPPEFSDMYLQHEHLLIALGRMKHEPGIRLLAKYLPKPPVLAPTDPPYVETYCQIQLRAAASWSLGTFYESGAPDSLAARLLEQARDDDLSNPEPTEVRAMAAISLGRIGRANSKTVDALTALRDGKHTQDMLAAACGWAVGQLTGKEVPSLTPRENTRLDWFLRPLTVER